MGFILLARCALSQEKKKKKNSGSNMLRNNPPTSSISFCDVEYCDISIVEDVTNTYVTDLQ